MFFQNILSAATVQSMKPMLMVLGVICVLLLLGTVIASILVARAKRLTSGTKKLIPAMMILTTLLAIACTVYSAGQYKIANDALLKKPDYGIEETEPSEEPATEPTTEPAPTEPPVPHLSPAPVADTNPDKHLSTWDISVEGKTVKTYNREEPISFGAASKYTNVTGVISFRGDNYRTGASYGTTTVTANTLTKIWAKRIGGFNGWSGIGWTGQPLIVKWDEQTKQIMNLFDEKKAKTDLVEVIATTLDGNIYFYDLEDGSYTRNPLKMGMNFKGTASLDPRGYPLMFIGSGDDYGNKRARMYAISLIDCSILFEQSGKDGFNFRSWYAFDASPMISAETDTVIWPGENGVFYTFKLNTKYDPQAGTLSINPSHMVKARYKGKLNRSKGVESSPIIVDNYMFAGDNGAYFFCIDLNTMKPVWVQNVGDDTNATPVFEWGEDGQGYIYTGTSMEYGKGSSHLYKLNANTGEIVWKKTYKDIPYNKGVSGGVLSSVALGKKGSDMEGMVLFNIARTPSAGKSIFVALDTETGEVIWEKTMSRYCWSSPVIMYNEENKGYIIQCDSGGNAHLLDGKTGNDLGKVELGANVEASPAVFENTIVVGIRGGQCIGIKVG